MTKEKGMLKGLKLSELEKREEIRIHFVGVSHDTKTGIMSATYSSCNTCPQRCPLRRGGGCYAENGHCNIHFVGVSAGITGTSPDELKDAIDNTPHCNIVRHNVAGDIAKPGTSDIDEKLLDTLCKAYKGLTAYTYTHCDHTERNFNLMKKAIDNGFVVNSSCETMEQVKKAMNAGVPAVIAVNTMNGKVATVDGVKVVKCPNSDDKTRTCNGCRLCMMKERKFAVAFPVHGTKKATATKSGNLIDIE